MEEVFHIIMGVSFYQYSIYYSFFFYELHLIFFLSNLVGKCRKEWLESTISPTGMGMLRAIKKQVDPKNIFANNNLMMDSYPKL